jgi:hypothetical protein
MVPGPLDALSIAEFKIARIGQGFHSQKGRQIRRPSWSPEALRYAATLAPASAMGTVCGWAFMSGNATASTSSM